MGDVLIVDDQLRDAWTVQKAVERYFLYKRESKGVRIARSAEDAIAQVRKQTPKLVVTDLFMPTEDFSTLKGQCDEMTYPHGLTLLAFIKDKVPAVVTTFYWDYPGFARFTSAFDNLGVHAFLPKDLFYLTAILPPGVGPEQCPPFRIIYETFEEVFKNVRGVKADPTLQGLRFRALFDEACAWLSTHAHLALEARHRVIDGAERKRKKAGSPWEESAETVQYASVSPWMPLFEFRSPHSGYAASPESYKALMEDTCGTEWAVNMRATSALTLACGHKLAKRANVEGVEQHDLKYYVHAMEPLRIDGFLKPPAHKDFAQVLLTLSFYSYWCHLADHRATRTAEDLVTIIETRAGVFYKDLTGKKAAKAIADDIESLSLRINEEIKSDFHNDWWRFLMRAHSVGSIEKRRDGKASYRYWLNASLVLI